MAFKGLFIGVDRYASSEISWLDCATRDAVALDALFSDNLGDNTKLLVDENATRAGIKGAFEELQNCDEDDTVVISFSGHGSETHELITHDADPKDLKNTAIPLEELKTWFAEIPSKRLVIF
jgi:helicase